MLGFARRRATALASGLSLRAPALALSHNGSSSNNSSKLPSALRSVLSSSSRLFSSDATVNPTADAAASPTMTSFSTTGTGRHVRDTASTVLQLCDEEKAEIMAGVAQANIRNFSIIAHIDHGKSTLADRLLGFAGNISRNQRETGQVLDKLEVERARGITVKAQTASIYYRNPTAQRGDMDHSYLLNLVDCPGHVDFAYEVSRSLAACQVCPQLSCITLIGIYSL